MFPKWVVWVTVAALCLLAAGTAVIYDQQGRAARQLAVDQLVSINQHKVEQLALWRADRLRDARELSESPFLAAGIAGALASPADDAQATLLNRLRSIQRQQACADVMLVDPAGAVRLSLAGRRGLSTGIRLAVADALRHAAPSLTDIHEDPDYPQPHLSVIAPIHEGAAADRPPVGAVVLVHTATTFLYPLAERWPVPTRSAESVLVRRDGRDILFLSRPRFRPDAAMQMRIPLSDTSRAGVRAVLGERGVIEGSDYRGRRVVAVAGDVPDSTWLLISKMDADEAYEPWRRRALVLALGTGWIFLGVPIALTLIWLRSERRYYRERYAAESALRATIERHATTLRSIGDAVIATDADARVDLLNPVAEALTGWANTDARGRPLAEVFRLVHEATGAEAESPAVRVLRDGQAQPLAPRTLLVARDGRRVPIADSAAPIRSDDGRVVGAVIVFRDRTAEREREQALLDSERKYRAVFDASADAILLLDETGFFHGNDAAVRMFGAPDLETLCALGPADVSPERQPDGRLSRAAAADHLRQVLADGSVSFEWTHKRLDSGEPFPAEVTLSRLELGGRKVVNATMRDVTERHRMQEAIERRIVALTRPLDAGEAVSFTDLFNPDEIQRIQDEFAAATGVASIITTPGGEPLTRPSNFTRLCSEIVRGHDAGRARCFRSDAELGRDLADGPRVLRCLSAGLWDAGVSIRVGPHHLANWLIGQVRDDQQSIEDVRAYAQEIGADPAAMIEAFCEVPVMPREQFERVARALQTLATQLSISAYMNVQQARFIAEQTQAEAERDRLQDQLFMAQKMESVGRLAGGVAHDFNNMLGAILGYSEIAMGRLPEGHPAQADLQEVQKAAQRSADLTRQLLAFARRQTIAPRVIDLNDTVSGLIKMLGRLIGEQITLTWIPRARHAAVKMDPGQVDQLLANLCVNASDAIDGVGTITIETADAAFDAEYAASHPGAAEGAYVRLSVTDDGCGMDKAVLGHVFEPFFTTKETGKGTGLGLATVYGIVKQNNGFVSVYSERGQGTTVNLFLPHEAPARAETPEAPPPPRTGTETVLIIEDEPSVLRLARVALGRLGYTVLGASTPGDAIQIARDHDGPIHVLLTDVVMPQMNGRDLVARIRQARPGVPCVFMSGYTADVIANRGMLEPGVVFIQKPFSVTGLADKVREALAAAGPAAGSAPDPDVPRTGGLT